MCNFSYLISWKFSKNLDFVHFRQGISAQLNCMPQTIHLLHGKNNLLIHSLKITKNKSCQEFPFYCQLKCRILLWHWKFCLSKTGQLLGQKHIPVFCVNFMTSNENSPWPCRRSIIWTLCLLAGSTMELSLSALMEKNKTFIPVS